MKSQKSGKIYQKKSLPNNTYNKILYQQTSTLSQVENLQIEDIILDSNDKIRVLKGFLLIIGFFTLILSSMILYNSQNYNPNIILTEENYINNNLISFNNKINKNFPIYKLISKNVNKKEKTIYLEISLENFGDLNPYKNIVNPIKNIKIVLKFTKDKMRIKIFESEKNNFEISKELYNKNNLDFNSGMQILSLDDSNLYVKIFNYPFGFQILRKINNEIIFDSYFYENNNEFENCLFLSDKFIQFSTKLTENNYIYNISNKNNFESTLFYNSKENPFDYPNYIIINKETLKVFGIFIFNSSPILIKKNDNNYFNFKMLSGIIDFYIFDGPRIKDIPYQIHSIFGLPQATNFEMLCMNSNKYKTFLSPININDDLYLKYKNFDICYYNLNDDNKKKIIVGKINEYFINNNLPFNDDYNDYCLLNYENENALEFRREFIKKINPNSDNALILVMNEPYLNTLNHTNEININNYENVIKNNSKENSIEKNFEILTHNIYNLYENKIIYNTINDIINRPLLFTVSSFIGIQQYSGQYLKNVEFSWKGLADALQKIIYFNLFGNPNVLCDIDLNFNLFNTNQELFIRFMQVLSLNIHFVFPDIFNEINNDNIDNNSYKILKNILKIRNSLYLYIYTYHLKNHYEGGGFFLPLSSYIAANKEIFKINDEFMLGANILVSPILKANERIKPTYFGLIKSENYYDFYTFEKIDFSSNEYIEIKAPLSKVPMFLRGGFITPILDINDNEYNINANDIKNKNVDLIVALDYDYNSQGKIILDNNSDEYYRMELVSIYEQEKNNIVIIFRVIHRSYVPNSQNDFKKFGKIFVLGLNKRPNRILYCVKNNEIDDVNEIEYNKIDFDDKNILNINLDDINLLLNTDKDYKIILEDI